jgi:DNA segregation ATPase FtsK/SpoIIIE-like protein
MAHHLGSEPVRVARADPLGNRAVRVGLRALRPAAPKVASAPYRFRHGSNPLQWIKAVGHGDPPRRAAPDKWVSQPRPAKSELLRTLVLGLITTHSSEALNLVLVDFKGGATFAGANGVWHRATEAARRGEPPPPTGLDWGTPDLCTTVTPTPSQPRSICLLKTVVRRPPRRPRGRHRRSSIPGP